MTRQQLQRSIKGKTPALPQARDLGKTI